MINGCDAGVMYTISEIHKTEGEVQHVRFEGRSVHARCGTRLRMKDIDQYHYKDVYHDLFLLSREQGRG